MNSNYTSCKHSYNIDYLFRMPNPFFRSLPCDHCGCRIQLSLPWRIFYWIFEIMSLTIAYCVAKSTQIRILGNTFLVSILIFLILTLILQQLSRLIFKYGKWVEVNK
jgi:hypothetical protein